MEANDKSSALMSKTRLLSEQMDRILNLYQHHYDLFMRGCVFYVSIMGAIATLFYRSDNKTSHQEYVLVLAGLVVSLLAVVSCVWGKKFANTLNEKLEGITKELGIPEIPLSRAINLISLIIFLASAKFLAFLFELIRLIEHDFFH